MPPVEIYDAPFHISELEIQRGQCQLRAAHVIGIPRQLIYDAKAPGCVHAYLPYDAALSSRTLCIETAHVSRGYVNILIVEEI